MIVVAMLPQPAPSGGIPTKIFKSSEIRSAYVHHETKGEDLVLVHNIHLPNKDGGRGNHRDDNQ